jgi:hypothetical protein
MFEAFLRKVGFDASPSVSNAAPAQPRAAAVAEV